MIEPTGPEYYAKIAYPSRPEDERNCPRCNGATVVRHAELTPGRPGFGTYQTCPQWRSDAKRCVRLDSMGMEI